LRLGERAISGAKTSSTLIATKPIVAMSTKARLCSGGR
jgi:hypothetical protein